MGMLLDILKPTSTWTVDQVRTFLERHNPEDTTWWTCANPRSTSTAICLAPG
jgi:hypothetical protein